MPLFNDGEIKLESWTLNSALFILKLYLTNNFCFCFVILVILGKLHV